MQTDFKPNWKPLEKKISNRCQEFMYMGRVGGINLYKHILTRRYVNLDDLDELTWTHFCDWAKVAKMKLSSGSFLKEAGDLEAPGNG